MKELAELSAGLMCSNTLLLKENGNLLECQFLSEGLPKQVVQVQCKTLAAALREECMNGILEGAGFTSFRGHFDRFSLRVKARKLYLELSAGLPAYAPEVSMLAVA